MAVTLSNPSIIAQIVADIVSGRLSGNVRHAYSGPTLTIGSGAGQIQKIVTVDFTVSAGTPLDYDLTAIDDPGGSAISFSFLTHLMIENLSTTAGQDMSLGAGANPVYATADAGVIQANGGVSFKATPNPGVTIDATHKTIRITVAAGTNVQGRLTLIGR